MSYAETARAKTVVHPDYGTVLVASFPQHDDVIRELKRWLDNGFARMRWDEENKVWLFDNYYSVMAINILDEFFDKLIYPDPTLAEEFAGAKAKPRARPNAAFTEDPWVLLGLRPDADPDVMRAAYRALARKWHPDCGDTDALMQKLNAAWEKIQPSIEKEDPTTEDDSCGHTEGCEY